MQQKYISLIISILSTSVIASDWRPSLQDNWDIQLSTTPTSLFDSKGKKLSWIELDMATDPNTIHYYESNAVRTVCYFSAGSAEKWRPDFKAYPKKILGNVYAGFADERWVDIRSELLKPIIVNRIKQCKNNGFSAIDPDNLNAYQNKTGFALRKTNQVIFNKWIASEIHKQGLKAILKNGSELLPNLKYDFDVHLTESCLKDNFCDMTQSFSALGKPVYNIEYLDSNQSKSTICTHFKTKPINTILKSSTFNIDGYRDTCN